VRCLRRVRRCHSLGLVIEVSGLGVDGVVDVGEIGGGEAGGGSIFVVVRTKGSRFRRDRGVGL